MPGQLVAGTPVTIHRGDPVATVLLALFNVCDASAARIAIFIRTAPISAAAAGAIRWLRPCRLNSPLEPASSLPGIYFVYRAEPSAESRA
ncbi:conserved membrane hypothetical protein [Bradyrhizobium oligotrophicum S58]|uniref:Uncharacterized protein n=1 Tax=Bradyrhizobium oligotrophicum S58 TaxID=1245469 RepID=M4Z1T1_9BRAD|nr:conserved membrane hypothetical protein [Bradyrhizobium oligotrophicum S58]